MFKPSGRSQAFTDRFFAYWRFAAPVWMIAGPDLAGAYMEPDEFFKYLRGRRREHFIADPGEAAPRVASLDRLRDPDGRFRVTEVYCTADTWQPTVQEQDMAGDRQTRAREFRFDGFLQPPPVDWT